MNVYQRIILVLGAIAVLVVVVTAPKVHYYGQGAIERARPHDPDAVVDVRTVSVRLAGVLGITALVCLALRGVDPNSAVTTASFRRGVNRLFVVGLAAGAIIVAGVVLYKPPDRLWDEAVGAVFVFLIILPVLLYALTWGTFAAVRWVVRGFRS